MIEWYCSVTELSWFFCLLPTFFVPGKPHIIDMCFIREQKSKLKSIQAKLELCSSLPE